MTIQPNDQVIEVGHTKTNATNGSVAMLRYTNDLSPITGPVANDVIQAIKLLKFPIKIVGGQPNAKGTVLGSIQNQGICPSLAR
jgi:hypothetical protein